MFKVQAIAAGIVLLAFAAGAARAQPPLRGPGAQPPAVAPDEAAASVQGSVRSFLLTPAGDVAGVLLKDGTQVDMPPHLSTELTQVVRIGDLVDVRGVRAGIAPVVRATEITSRGRTVRVDGPPMPLPPNQAAAAPPLVPLTTEGRVAAVLHTPRGDVGGVVMQDGTQVRFPPPAADSAPITVGSTLFARGYGTQGPQGRVLEATALRASPTTVQPVFGEPGPRPGLAGGPPPDGARVAPPPPLPRAPGTGEPDPIPSATR